MAIPSFFCLQFLIFAFTIIQTRAGLPGAGTWELLVPNAGIASMHTAVTPFNTAILLDRTNIGLSRLPLPNGQCRDDPFDDDLKHDCSAHSAVLDLDTNEIRPLEILTDTWCSSGQFLPNGTLLQTGGNGDGNRKLRMFTPCEPSSFCDWVELQNMELSQGRWYATNQILPDGSVIIIGGASCSSVEYFPARADGAVSFPFLVQSLDNQTDNLYPYLHLLPQGNLFVFANNQSVLYDYDNNVVLKVFPQLEGGPRNYPSAGSSVMLALENDYSTATIIICGGAPYGAFNNKSVSTPALEGCGRIVATDSNPIWEMEEMPLARVMGDMVMLPTGDVLIINGAQAGTQGYGMASNPCLTPVLYQPDQPLGSRFSMLAPGTIPRLYHSTANLLPDGRILLAGSNTHYVYDFVDEYPTEMRIEAFSPGYLATDNTNLRPVVVTTPKTVQYGNIYNTYVTVPTQLITGTVEVNLVSAPYVTHSFSQGQRLVKLVVNRVVPNINGQYMIVWKTPPNGMVAPPSYYMMFVVNKGVPSVASWVQLIS